MTPTIFLILTMWAGNSVQSKSYQVMRTMDECRWTAPMVLHDATRQGPRRRAYTVECVGLTPMVDPLR